MRGRSTALVVAALLVAGCAGKETTRTTTEPQPSASISPASTLTTNVADETAAITRAALAGIMGQGTDDSDAFIDHPDGIKAQRDALAAAYPEQRNARLAMKLVTLTSPTDATFVYDVELAPPLAAQSLRELAGHAVKANGAWKVTRATACQVWGFGNGTCPITPSTTASAAGSPLLRDGVLYSIDGLRLVNNGVAERDPTISGPIASAYRLSDGRIIYQRGDDNGIPTGPIVQRAGTRENVILNSGPLDKLLDVAYDGIAHWQALISRRSGTDPGDTISLLRYDLDDDTTHLINRGPGWEYGYSSARITPSGILYVSQDSATPRYGMFRNDGTHWYHDGTPDHDGFTAIYERASRTVILTNLPAVLTIDPTNGDATKSTPINETCRAADLSARGQVACTGIDSALVIVDLATGAAQQTAQRGAYTFTRS